MTVSTIEPIQLTVTAADRRIARYAAAAIALTVAEAGFPSPLPGVKPGLANIVVLIVLARHGRNVPIPFGPYLAAAGVIALFWGASLNKTYLGLM